MSNANSTLSLTLKLNGLAQVENGLKRFFGVIDSNGRALTRSGGTLALLKGGLRELAGPLLAGASVAGFVALTKHSAELAETLGRTAHIAGVTVKEMAGIAYAAEQDDIALQELGVGLRTFSKHLVATGQGSRNMREALLEQAEIFQRLPDGAAKSARAVDLFGRSGERMGFLLSKGPKELQALFERGGMLSGMNEKMALTAEQFDSAFKDFKLAVKGLTMTLAADLLPVLSRILGTITNLIVKFREWSKESQVFQVAKENTGTIAGAGLGALGVAKIFGALRNAVGPITSLSELGIAISLLGKRAMVVAGTIGVVAAGIVGAITSIVAGREFMRMREASRQEEESGRGFAEQNKALADSLRKTIDLRIQEGKITEQQAESLRQWVDMAMKVSPEGSGDRLHAISRRLVAMKDSPSQGGRVWTKEDLDVQNKSLEIDISKEEILKEKSALSKDLIRILGQEYARNQALGSLRKIEDLTMQKLVNASEAKEQKVISEIEFAQIDLAVRKDLLSIEKERAAIEESRRAEQAAETRQNFRLTEAEKFSRLRGLAASPQEAGALGPDPTNFAEQFKATWVDLQNQMGTVAQQTARSFADVWTAAIASVTGGISGLIMGTMTWGQALQQIGSTILNTIVQSIVQMGVKWVMTHVLMRGAMAVTHAIGVALGWNQVAQTNAQEASKAPLLAVNAANASTSSYGAAALIGAALAIAAISLVSAAALGAFYSGGYTGDGGKYSPAGIVHRGEFVFDQATTAAYRPLFERIHSGNASAQDFASFAPAGGASGNRTDFKLYVVDDVDVVHKLQRSEQGEAWVLSIMDRHAHRYARR